MYAQTSFVSFFASARFRCIAAIAVATSLTCFWSGAAQAAQVAHWRFDGNLLDSSPNGNNLVVGTGAASYSGTTPTGYGGQAFDFNGATRLDVSSPTNFGFTTYTIAAWVNAPLPDASGYSGLFWRGPSAGTGSDIEIYAQKTTNDVVVAHNRSNTGTFDFTGFADPPASTYYHLAVTYDAGSGTVTTYYNGVAASVTQNTAALVVPLVTPGFGVSVGKLNHSLFTPNFFNGLVDEMFVYDEVLTLTQINNLIQINATTPAPEPSSLALLALGAMFVARRRKQRRVAVGSL